MILKYAVLILYVTSLVFFASAGRADDSLTLKSIIDSHTKLDSEFADLHCRWKASETKNGETRDYLLEFWSKEGKFYRFDKTETGSNEEAFSTKTRMVIRPEGFVIINVANANNAGVIIDFGSSFDGFDRLAAVPFFNSATRYESISQVREAVERSHSKSGGWSELDLDRSKSLITLAWNWSNDEWRTESNVLLDVPTYRCLSSTIKSYRNGKLHSTRDTRKKYDENFVVPESHDETRTYSDGTVTETKYERTFCSFDSPPIEVFAVSANGLGTQNRSMNIWIRRLILLVVGVSLLAIYFTYRNKETST